MNIKKFEKTFNFCLGKSLISKGRKPFLRNEEGGVFSPLSGRVRKGLQSLETMLEFPRNANQE